MSSLGTLWFRTKVMNRYWAIVTYALSVMLLLSVGFSLWILLIFPAWVFAVSIRLLVQKPRTGAGGTPVRRREPPGSHERQWNGESPGPPGQDAATLGVSIRTVARGGR